ncbi:MAG TPA: beta-ketoacyl synthase N-terminal-like domain-containing protein, partial [Bryobacteraceae bacterium]|nr:beta-ketoacyl synthase N-terminal-like domain-containing protein [Bryobacteraceae bacterium]
PEKALTEWRKTIRAGVAWRQPETDIWPLGQDAAFAAPLARRFRTVSGIVRGLRDSVRRHVELAKKQAALGEGAPLAQFHGTGYPVLQGPMTRVSDTAAFAQSVAENGALPFLALALLRAPQVRKLLAETKELLGARPWGVGILGFVPVELRSEQLEVVREFRPPFAIIAGGRPDQAAGLERDGICTYLHVPAPALLRMFLQDGARGFIFEGRECGGHVGPRTSFVLWETMIEVLLDEIRKGTPAAELRIVFAGGIHDARSAAMVAAMASPLVEQGVRIGVLLGTAYLFTEEAVRTGAIVEGFQREALACRKTVLLESGPGHATRCVETPFYETFRNQKRRLLAERKSTGEVREALENLNIGRLRVASKGVAHMSGAEGSQPRYIEIPKEQQRLDGMYMIGQVAALRRSTCSMRDLHKSVSTAGVALLHQTDAPAGAGAEPVRSAPCDVAIVGMSCMLPKAPDLQSFWRNVVNKVHAITDIPVERFNVDLYFDADRRARDKIYSRWGGFLEDAPFDPMRYGIPPNALASIDPMQLLALVVVDRALADAGYRDRDFPRDKTSVIFGLSGGLGDLGIQYAVRSLLGQFVDQAPEGLLAQLPEWTEDSFAGILPNVTAGRVANRFDLGGVNFAVDAACASSLAAVYLAARELTSRASDMVIVGGVDTVQSPFGYLCFSKSQALSPRGACRTFDATADGIAISEGISMLVLKRLEDAERDGDRIYAVIKGVAGSSDGRGRSMTAPRLEGQIAALDRAYAQAGIRPSTVGLIEAHGTGTAAGDAAELAALSTVFAADGAAPQSCSIGSVKSMVGHTKSAAGVTGVMKAALALYHKTLPPTLHVEQPNAKLCEPGSAFFVNSDPRPWSAAPGPDSEATPRRAGVSSFGFGGTNFHAVLEEYSGDIAHPADRANLDRWPAELFIWNAPTSDALASSIEQFAARLENAPP